MSTLYQVYSYVTFIDYLDRSQTISGLTLYRLLDFVDQIFKNESVMSCC